jgi:hypothetical protein
MSFAMTIVNVGINNYFLKAWLTGWGIGFLASLPFSCLIPPLVQKIMKMLKI